MTTRSSKPATGASLVIALAVALATLMGVAALWTAINLRLDALNGWMAIVAALDAALMLRLAGIAPGTQRATMAAACTLLASILVAYLSAAIRTGLMFGLDPLQAVQSMSAAFAWTLTLAAASWLDPLFVGIALLLAWRLAR